MAGWLSCLLFDGLLVYLFVDVFNSYYLTRIHTYVCIYIIIIIYIYIYLFIYVPSIQCIYVQCIPPHS